MDNNQNRGEDTSAADDIAAEITKILVKAFSAKEGREPTAEEVEQLIEELTEERIESMLSGFGDVDENIDDNSEGSEAEDEVDEVLEGAGLETVEVPSSGIKRQLEEGVTKVGVSEDENGNPNESKKVKSAADIDVPEAL